MELKGYTNIPDWMLSLELDVYETIILAVIYGFSQDGESTFTGSWNYLSAKAKCSRRKVANALVSLTEKGLVKKIDRDIKGIHLCEYYCTICTGSARDARGGAYDAPNNIDNTIDINIEREYKKEKFSKPTLEELTTYCTERANGIDPEEFFAFYESKGWMIGKSKMKDWKATIRTWEIQRKKNVTRTASQPQRKESVYEHNLRVADQLFGTNYHGQIYGKKEVADEQ